MDILRNATQRLDENISNAGNPPRGNQVPPLKEDVNNDQAPVNPSRFMDGYIRASLFQMAQAITIQAKATTTQAQAMTAQANREVVPYLNQQVATMASRLRDFTWMNLPTFYRSKVEEDHQ